MGGTSYNLSQEESLVLAIRLARIGKKKKPFYRVVVLDKRKPRNGRTVEIVGTYDPLKKPAEIKLDAERIKYWLGCGAQPSDTVRSFLPPKRSPELPLIGIAAARGSFRSAHGNCASENSS